MLFLWELHRNLTSPHESQFIKAHDKHKRRHGILPTLFLGDSSYSATILELSPLFLRVFA